MKYLKYIALALAMLLLVGCGEKEETTSVQTTAETTVEEVTTVPEYVDLSDSIVTSGDYEVAVVDGFALISRYIGTDADVVIPDTINGLPVAAVSDTAFSSLDFITSVKIPEGVLGIGNGAFFCCTNLTSVELPSTLTFIGESAFFECDNLVDIEIPDAVTLMGNGVFLGCDWLDEIKIPSGVTSIGDYTFFGCYFLESIEIPDSVTSIGEEAFGECFALTVKCSKGSYAETYANENSIPVEYID